MPGDRVIEYVDQVQALLSRQASMTQVRFPLPQGLKSTLEADAEPVCPVLFGCFINQTADGVVGPVQAPSAGR